MPVPEELKTAVASLSEATGIEFAVTDDVVPGTRLYVVYSPQHELPDRYNQATGVLGFRVPANYPDVSPEDAFFLQTAEPLKLASPEPSRRSTEIHRASMNGEVLKGTVLSDRAALVFSWHLWNHVRWDRRKHTLIDHYNHCLRRFEQSEHD